MSSNTSYTKTNLDSTSKTSTSTNPLFSIDPVSISWHHIEVFSKPTTKCFCFRNKPSIQIVKDVSGYLKAGRTLAIMGSSGAGKTTLLNVLTARNLSTFIVDGVVKINHQIADVQTITSLTAYVQQSDMFIPTLTVREHLVFQALIRMSSQIPLKAKAIRINQVMSELSLLKCADTQVGGQGSFKGISGGEMKRLSFAVEILTNPSIMFCDEPTSGLDAYMAENLVKIIRKMAKNGRSIICTIHQPSSDVFGLFDNLLLLADGRVAYMGELKKALPYFAQMGIKCPVNYNPADFFIKELSIIPGKEHECRNKVNMICDFHSATHPSTENLRKQSSFINPKKASPFRSTSLQQYKALGWRSYLIAKREPMLTNVRVGQALFISVLFGVIYFRQSYDERGAMNINGALFLLLTNLTYQNAFAVINTLCAEFPIFLREYNSGMYRVHAYFICKNLAEYPVFVLIPILFVSIYYYMVGFYPYFSNFLLTMLIGILVSTCGVAFGYLMSCVSKQTDIALAITAPILMPLQLFGGFFINLKSVSPNYAWIKELSWFYYGYELLANNQWKDVQIISCTGNSTDGGTYCGKTGRDIVKYLGLKDDTLYRNTCLIFLISFVLRFLSYLILLIRAKSR